MDLWDETKKKTQTIESGNQKVHLAQLPHFDEDKSQGRSFSKSGPSSRAVLDLL